MKEIAQNLLAAPLNWTGLTLKELVNAGRIPDENVNGYLKEMAQDFLNKKYDGCYTGPIKDYLKEKEELFIALYAEFSAQ